MIDYDKLKKIPDELKHAIIKEHMKTYYHWTVGILCFLIGTFFGLLIGVICCSTLCMALFPSIFVLFNLKTIFR